MDIPGPRRSVRGHGGGGSRRTRTRTANALPRRVLQRRKGTRRRRGGARREESAGVGWHRARTLKLTGWWDDALFLCEDDERAMHTAAETAAEAARCDGRDAGAAAAPPPYRVRVTPMGGGSPHENMARTLREEMDPTTGRPRFKAVVSFRPTGWSYARGRAGDRAKIGGGAGDSRSGDRAKIALPSTEDANAETAGRFEDGDGFVRVKDEVVDGDVSARVKVESTEGMAEAGDVASGSGSGSAAALAASWRPWIENDGATRCYSVPYSEHSSFDELVAFVARVRPVKVTPTVNADTRADRDRMLKYFLPYTDLAEDKGRLDHYFRRPAALPRPPPSTEPKNSTATATTARREKTAAEKTATATTRLSLRRWIRGARRARRNFDRRGAASTGCAVGGCARVESCRAGGCAGGHPRPVPPRVRRVGARRGRGVRRERSEICAVQG